MSLHLINVSHTSHTHTLTPSHSYSLTLLTPSHPHTAHHWSVSLQAGQQEVSYSSLIVRDCYSSSLTNRRWVFNVLHGRVIGLGALLLACECVCVPVCV